MITFIEIWLNVWVADDAERYRASVRELKKNNSMLFNENTRLQVMSCNHLTDGLTSYVKPWYVEWDVLIVAKTENFNLRFKQSLITIQLLL